MRSAAATQIARGKLGDSRWEVASREPAPTLRPWVRRIVGYDERSPRPQSQRQFPIPSTVLILELGPPLRVVMGGDEETGARHPGGFVAGLGELFADVEHQGHQRGIQVDLTPTGARRLLGLPLCELAGLPVALADLQPAEHRRFLEQLDASPDWASRIDLVEAFLHTRLIEARIDTRRVDWAVEQIEATGGALEVASLARELGTSHKHLITLFRDQVGVPPKLLARLVRFERLLERVRAGVATPWAELALDLGYYDQAHMAREVKRLTGLTPTQTRASVVDLAGLFG